MAKRQWPDHISQSFKAGHEPKPTTIKQVMNKRSRLIDKGGLAAAQKGLTIGEQVIAFSTMLVVPEGEKVGEPLELDPFQIAFILAGLSRPGVKLEKRSDML